MFNANSGYYGYSMSQRAMECYSDGIMPMSQWTKTAILNAIQEEGVDIARYQKLKVSTLKKLLSYDSWHHTSSHFNRTDFYKVDIEAYTIEELEQLNQTKTEKYVDKDNGKKVQGDFNVWGGTRSYPKILYVETLQGVYKDGWLVTEKGKKKKLSSNSCVKWEFIG